MSGALFRVLGSHPRDLAAASKGMDLPIICAQNGVENERLAARRYAQVYAMMVWTPATFVEPGEVPAPPQYPKLWNARSSTLMEHAAGLSDTKGKAVT